MQLDFLIKEIAGYSGVCSTLKSAKSVRAASDKVLLEFERPADQSEAVKIRRANYGQKYYDKYATKAAPAGIGGNSGLVDCTVYSPNHSGKRTRPIDTLTPHCVVGQLTAERIGACFPKGRNASCNYGIGTDGRVSLIVDECNRSWCSSSNANDQRAVTIECASDTTHPYAMNSKVYDKLVKLCTDICRRNGKTKVLWLGSKEKTLAYTPKSDEMVLTAHRWFANKACPGEWLYSRYGELAEKINAALGSGAPTASASAPAPVPRTATTITKMAAAPLRDSSAKNGKRFTTTEKLNLRYGPSAEKIAETTKDKYGIIATLPKGTGVMWYGFYAVTNGVKWLYVAAGNKTGWVSSAYLK